jgi:transposase
MPYFAGLDWASAEHAVCVIDATGTVQAQFSVTHSAAGIAELRQRLRRFGDPAELAVAIERPDGPIVDALVDAGHPVVPIHPNAMKASRPRYSAAQGKSDPADAFILADILRTDGHRFPKLRPPSDETRALRARVRARDDLVAHRVGLANQLRSLLESFWPGAAVLFADIDSPISLAFLGSYPTPQSAERLGEKRLASFLAKHAYPGRRTPAALLERLRQAVPGLCGKAESVAKGALVRALVKILALLVTQIQRLTADIEHAVEQHPDGPIIMSLPRSGRVNAAQILAELGDDRARFSSDDQLAAEAGVAPVTYASGKRRGVGFRWACNKRLRRALTCFSDNSRHSSAWAATHYSRARDRGCDHAHAIRILARAWLRVLWRCWQDHKTYDHTLHRAAAHIAA